MRLESSSNTQHPVGLHLALSAAGVDQLIERLMTIRVDPSYSFRLSTTTTGHLISIEFGRQRKTEPSNADLFDSDRD